MKHLLIAAFIISCQFAEAAQPKKVAPKLEDLILSPSVIKADDLKPQEYDYSARAALLRGFDKDANSITEESCVTGTSRPSKSILERSLKYSDVFDRETVRQALQVSASGTYGAASGRAEYARTLALDRSKRMIVATASIAGGGDVVDSAGKLTNSALSILNDRTMSKSDRLNNFFMVCGDAWISEIKHGAQLNSVFSIALNDETLAETFEIEAAVSAGAAQAQAKAKSAVENVKEQRDITFQQKSWGGPTVITANKSTEMMTTLLNFSNIGVEDITPFTMIVSSYQLLPNWPKDLKYSSVSPKIRMFLSGHIGRLRALEVTYTDAATQPLDFYYPFDNATTQEIRQNAMMERADILRDAARCLENVINVCSRLSQCNSVSVLATDAFKGTCPALDDPEPRYSAMVAAMVLGTNPKSIPSSASKKLLPALSRVAKELNRPFGARKLTAAEANFSPAAIYYQFLAEAPIRRNWNPDFGTRTLLDDTKQIDVYCKYIKISCAAVTYDRISGISPPADSDMDATTLYRQWVTRTKVLPVNGSFCNLDRDHPMCRSLAEIVAVRQRLTPRFGEARNFGPAPAPIKTPDRHPDVPCKVRPGAARSCDGGLI